MYVQAPLGALGKKKKVNRKDLFFETKAAEIEAARAQLEPLRAIAEGITATQEDVDAATLALERYNQLVNAFNSEIAAFEAAELRKGKTLTGRLKKLQVRKLKVLKKLGSPSAKKHVAFAERKDRARILQTDLLKLRAQPDSDAKARALTNITGELKEIADANKKYIKQGKIAAVVASIIIGFFTFGGGTAAVQGAFQALKQGAISVAKKILTSAVISALSKGLSKKEGDQAFEAINDLEKYPPDPNLTSLDSMIADSQAKKARARQTDWVVPAGIIAALAFLI